MRIAQIAPLAESVPPRLYGGTERVVAWLTDELVQLGHEVTLFASGDSSSRGKLVPVWERALRLGQPGVDPAAAQAVLLEAMASRAAEFDVIHCHIDWLHLPLLSRQSVPFVTTVHNRLDTPGLPKVIERFPHAPFISISNSQRMALPQANWLGTIYHGMPPDLLQPQFQRGKYLAFLGRVVKEKGPETAIRIAQAVDMPLRFAVKVPRAEKLYYQECIEPLLDGEKLRNIGEVKDRAKHEFLANAAALLFPIEWPEPFGLVMIEAMACGTPVIAFRCGSVPEVVDDGETGFIVDDVDSAVRAITRVPQLDRRGVRAGFERRFTARRMAQDYLRQYERLTGARAKVAAA